MLYNYLKCILFQLCRMTIVLHVRAKDIHGAGAFSNPSIETFNL